MNGAVNQLPEFESDDFEKYCIISDKHNFAFLVIFSPKAIWLNWSTYIQIIANDDPKPVKSWTFSWSSPFY